MAETLASPLIRSGRVDDADLNVLEEDTHLVGSAFNELESALNGNLLFNPSESLRTIDWHRRGNLLPLYKADDCTPGCQIKVFYNALGSFLGILDGLLTADEVDQIISNDGNANTFTTTETLEELPSHVSRPLGFGVSGAKWKIDGVNPAMRINTYTKLESFEAHRDAQFCESRRRRSVLSLVIYLSETLGGETRFYASEAV
eukprot:scaffold1971_cov127-Amphora_coffeaeformis.AAC.1